jgi:hypothetical protein
MPPRMWAGNGCWVHAAGSYRVDAGGVVVLWSAMTLYQVNSPSVMPSASSRRKWTPAVSRGLNNALSTRTPAPPMAAVAPG